MRLQPSPRWPSKLGVNTPCSTIWILETWTLSTSPPKRSSSKLLIIVHVCSTDAPGLRDCRKETSLHLLFCVADTVCPAKDKYTVQGYDMQFGANALGHLRHSTMTHSGILPRGTRSISHPKPCTNRASSRLCNSAYSCRERRSKMTAF